MGNVVVFDLETVPDTSVWTPPAAEPVDTSKCEKCGGPLGQLGPPDVHSIATLPKCPAMTRGKCRPAKAPIVKDVFPPPHAHKVVCIGWSVLQDDVPVQLEAIGIDGLSEANMLYGLGSFLENADGVVTWAGLRFDLPVLQLRSLRHGLSQPWYRGRMQGRYEDAHVDLADVLTLRGLSGDRLHMDDAARLIGLPGKDGVDGSQVAGLVAAGDMAAVRAYCSRDVVQTTYLYLRYRLLRGELSREAYTRACQALQGLWAGRPGFESWPTKINFDILELAAPAAEAAE